MKEVTIYEIKDGSHFSSVKEAEKYEKELDFKEWYEENYICEDFDDATITAKNVMEWLLENKEPILKFYGVTK